ncbi:hypothetical protein ACP70R_020518 [Stipagrostis hirtigluma subsp. patula]
MDPALYKAATQGSVASLRRLVAADRSILVSSTTPDGKTALHIAASHGYTDFAREVLDAAEELLVAKTAGGDTPLHLAAREGRLGVAELLVGRARASPQDLAVETPVRNPLVVANGAGETPLHEAVRHRRSAVALMLLEAEPGSGHAPNARMETPLHVAAREGLVDVVDRILSSGQWPELNSGSVSGTPLHQAALGGHIRITEILLEKRPELINLTDSNGNNALHNAAHKNHRDVVDILLKKQRELASHGNNTQQSPLHVAAHHGATEAIRVLLKHCPDLAETVDGRGRNAFHAAVASGRTSALRCLLRHARPKQLLNRVDNDGNTPLHLAAEMSRVHSAVLLLRDRCVDPCVVNRAGRTPRNLLELRGFDELDSLELYLWTELKKQESSRCREELPSVGAVRRQRSSGRERDYFERRIETYLLVAALVATVTFAATFTMPGGYNQTDGTAIHSHRTAFKVFVVSNTVAMSSSSVVLLCFLWAWKDPMKSKLDHLIWGHRLTFLACLAMLVSLMAAVDVTVAPTVRWPVYMVIAIGTSVPLIVGLILGKEVLFVPL